MGKIINPIQINDWEFKKFFLFNIFLHIIFLIQFFIDVDFLRGIICFYYITFVPGIILLRIIRLHNLGNINTILLSVGLSLGTLMIVGLLVNAILPVFGLEHPLSLEYILPSFVVLVNILFVLSYFIDKDFKSDKFIELDEIFSPIVLYFILIAILSVFGSLLVNYYTNNIILLIILPIISVTPVLYVTDIIKPKYYPISLFLLSVSLVLHTTLISNYIAGWDINPEYYFANFTLQNLYWDGSIQTILSGILSTTILPTMYSLFLKINMVDVFKIVFPVIFSLVPLGLFAIFKKQFNEKISVLSCFFFISFQFFFFNAPTGARQEIVEFFIVLFILLLTLDNESKIKRIPLILFCIFCIVISHYSTAFLFVTILTGAFILIKFTELLTGKKERRILNSNLIYASIAILLFWYIYIVNPFTFNQIIQILYQLFNSSLNDLFNPEKSQSIQIVLVGFSYSLSSVLEKIINIVFQGFIVFGILLLLFDTQIKSKIKFDFKMLCFCFFCLNIACFIIPNFAETLNTWRIYHITLIVLSPFAILGGVHIFRKIAKKIFSVKMRRKNSFPLICISIFLAVFLLFNTSWAYWLVDEYPYSLRSSTLSQNKIDDGSDQAINAFYSAFYTDPDVQSARWISKMREKNQTVYSDYAKKHLILTSYGQLLKNKKTLTTEEFPLPKNSIIYLGYSNTKYNIMHSSGGNNFWYLDAIQSNLSKLSKIYSSGFPQILKS